MKIKSDEASCRVVIDSRKNKLGYSRVYFRLIQENVKRDISTGILWPADRFNEAEQTLMQRFASDPDVGPYNLTLNEYKTVAHRLRLRGYLRSKMVGMDELLKEFKYVGKNIDFFRFMEDKIEELYSDNVIAEPTRRRHRCSLNTIKRFHDKPSLSFNDIDLDFIVRFNAWARKVHMKGRNTATGYHKDFKKYLSIAVRKDHIPFNPYNDFKFKYVDGNREALDESEIHLLYNLYREDKLLAHQQEILRRFLFSCFTGLRISDSIRITSDMIINKVLAFKPYKTDDKWLRIPVPEVAMSLIEGRTGKLFQEFSSDYINENLKIIAAWAGISKKLSFNVSRDTFGTVFIEMGGDVKSLKDLMGHENIKTTMIYLKMSDKRKTNLMNNFDRFMK